MGGALMATDAERPEGPDLIQGIPLSSLADGSMVGGHVGNEPVLLARRGETVFAVGARCTHYGGPLADGIVVDETVRCPWHHACFSLRTGEALAAPAFAPLDCWQVERRGDLVVVLGKREGKPTPVRPPAGQPNRIVIVGGGAAGFAAAEMARRRGFDGELTMISSDDAAPYDRPNLSKDYLAGEAPEEWIPLQGPAFYAEKHIGLHLRTRVERIDVKARAVSTTDGRSYPFDRLLLATGAEPIRLAIPGADRPHVLTLRSLADSRAVVDRAQRAKSAVVLGAGFIGLEVAGALRARGLAVHVVAPDSLPMEKILGREFGAFIRSLHERHGVSFHLQNTAARIEEDHVVLADGGRLDADLVVAGIGVRPRTRLAEQAGLKVDNGVLVDGRLETSVPGIFAAGDIARWPDAQSGGMVRVEHWVVAQRQGQTAALNMLGFNECYAAPPFFWSRHYDTSIQYVGHAAEWDSVEAEGSIKDGNGLVRYLRGGRVLAVASVGRDTETLRCEAAMERGTRASADRHLHGAADLPDRG
jgi:NADPH-dependent 2,4-dienoyl-CoA reductase/sulfur reductase-like enzyme/nitrite reductase/ring-hydroxylating ferredoxin subunit